MATEHRLIPDNERHEPKGISTASAGQVYRSNGSASGAWKDDVVCISGVIDDVSTAGFILIPLPVNGTILSIKAVLGGALASANSVVTITRGGDGGTVGTINIVQSGSAEGTTFNATPSGNADVSMNTHNYLKVATDGGSTNTVPLYIAIKMKVTE